MERKRGILEKSMPWLLFRPPEAEEAEAGENGDSPGVGGGGFLLVIPLHMICTKGGVLLKWFERRNTRQQRDVAGVGKVDDTFCETGSQSFEEPS